MARGSAGSITCTSVAEKTGQVWVRTQADPNMDHFDHLRAVCQEVWNLDEAVRQHVEEKATDE